MIRRRDVIVGLGVSAVVGSTALAAPAASDRIARLRRLTPRESAQALCRHLASDDEIGATPWVSADLLVARLGDVPVGGRALRKGIAACIRQDYAEGRVVVVRGWSMALTEARLAALWRDV